MTQKHHQEEISGPLDTIEAAPLAKDLPRPKRARIQSRKAQENQAQSSLFEVLSFRPATPSVSVPKPTLLDSSSPSERRVSISKLQRLSNSQNSSQQADTTPQDERERKEWQRQFESARTKPKKLKILVEHIGPRRSYPEKLNISIPYVLRRSLL